MSFQFASEQLADLRHHAQLLIERAGDHEGRLQALVAATAGDLRQAEAAVSHAADDLDVDNVRRLPDDAGFLVRTVSNGVEALIAAHEMRSRVIVMDVSMPVLDALEATRLINACETTRDARVIAYPGSPSFGHRRRARCSLPY